MTGRRAGGGVGYLTQVSIHLTPSNPNYAKDLRAWFHRQECW
jgi:hypothetical protein